MNLRQAYDGWSQQEQNRQLYVKTREAFRKSWFTLPTNKPCSWYTKDVLALALAETRVVESDKAKAASVMVHVLNWANFAEPKWNPKPTFEMKDVTRLLHLPADELEKERERITAAMQCLSEREEDAQPANHGDCPNDSSEAQIRGTVPCDSHRPGKGEETKKPDPCDGCNNVKGCITCVDGDQRAVITEVKPKEETNMEQKKPRGKAPKPVVQIDPETFEVVKEWPSRGAAESGTGACNLDRCIAKMRKSAGYYWCDPQDAKTFEVRLAMREVNEKCEKADKKTKKQAEVSPSEGDANHRGQSPCSPSATTHTGDSPHDSRPAAAQALAVFTDDELLEELDRRGWEGELSRRQVVTIGAR